VIRNASSLVMRADTQDLMKKIRVAVQEDLGEFATVAIVRTLNGSEFKKMVAEAKGSINFPMSETELMQKFVDCAGRIMSVSQAGNAGRLLLNIDHADNLKTIVQSLKATE